MSDIIGKRPPYFDFEPYERCFDEYRVPHNLPKTPLFREIFVAGMWLEHHLSALGVEQGIIAHECEDLGNSLFTAAISVDGVEFHAPQPLWEKAAAIVKRYESKKSEEEK